MIPTYEEVMLPFLKALSDGEEHELAEIVQTLADHFKLSEAEQRELLPSGKQTVFRNRIGWAKTYLQKAKLLESPKRARYKITERGKSLLSDNPADINSEYLLRYDEFVQFKDLRHDKSEEETGQKFINIDKSDQTPDEVLENAYQKLKNDLASELLDVIKGCTPAFFERLVDLVIAMGYGGSRKDAGQAMGKSGDGGIDGIIKEDKLGLDIIYLQAKRWENSVPVKEIRDFTGALASKKAKKGIFITTSSFPKSVYEFVSQVEYKIILIDGERLADLMIEHDVGVSTTNSYLVKQIDSDYFEET